MDGADRQGGGESERGHGLALVAASKYATCMLAILTEHDLKKCWRIPFCYLCGKSFAAGQPKNRDHVPPNSIFAKDDQVQPLILPTHRRCNAENSPYDEQIGQLVAVIHGKYPDPKSMKLTVGAVNVTGSDVPAAFVKNLQFQRIVFRWLRAFHAALYGQYLPSCGGYIHPPFPEFDDLPGRSEQSVRLYVETVKQNRVSKTIDTIVCRNGKCRYECFWSHTDDGRPMCVFALDIYGWSRLGDVHHYPQRSCVGSYMPPEGIPPSASRATTLVFPFANRDALDAFAD